MDVGRWTLDGRCTFQFSISIFANVPCPPACPKASDFSFSVSIFASEVTPTGVPEGKARQGIAGRGKAEAQQQRPEGNHGARPKHKQGGARKRHE